MLMAMRVDEPLSLASLSLYPDISRAITDQALDGGGWMENVTEWTGQRKGGESGWLPPKRRCNSSLDPNSLFDPTHNLLLLH
jgi:hypothetical protein